MAPWNVLKFVCSIGHTTTPNTIVNWSARTKEEYLRVHKWFSVKGCEKRFSNLKHSMSRTICCWFRGAEF